MGQEFHIVRCFSCQSFQVQQVKKVNRWSCKLCGEKQSLVKEFGRGSGADCRRHVQKLNAMRGAMLEEQERHTWSLWQQVEADAEDEPEEQRDGQVTHCQVSCWSKYLDTPEEAEPEEEEEENVLMDRQQLHGNDTIDRKRKRREGWTDRQGQDRWTPAQSNQATPSTATTSLRNTSPPSKKSTNPPNVSNTSYPDLRNTSLNSTSKRSLNPGLRNTSPSSKKSTSPPSVSNTSYPGLRNASLNSTSRLSKKNMNPPSVTTGVVSRWAHFLSSDCPVTGEEPSVSGRGQAVDGALSLPSNDVGCLAPPPARPHPLLPVFSMFQSEDDFNFSDKDFLINT